VHGVPGFEVKGSPVVARGTIRKADAVRIAADTFGIDGASAKRLETERDDSFAITAATGRFVLKVAHPADDPADIAFQTAALQHARRADPTLPMQRILPARDGALEPVLENHQGRIARLFEWLPGDLLIDSPPDGEQLKQLGDALARLTLALAGFQHPNMSGPFAWDLAQFPKLASLLDRFPHDDLREVFRRFDRVVAPRLSELPRQVVHNDFNPGNVLVDATKPEFVTGILDFGDTIHTIRVADVAVALCYQLYPSTRGWSDVQPFLAAYENRVRLTGVEHEVLKTLVEARFAQRVLINEWLSQFDDDRGRDESFRAGVRTALGRLLEED
jgi:hydroxylysine kinase